MTKQLCISSYIRKSFLLFRFPTPQKFPDIKQVDFPIYFTLLNMLQADLQVVLEELDTGKKGGLEFHDFVKMMTR